MAEVTVTFELADELADAIAEVPPSCLAEGLALAIEKAQERLDAEAADDDSTPWRRALLFKQDGEERYVLGVVMEPDETDTQGDTQDAATIRKACFEFMEAYRGGGTAGHLGLMHKQMVDGKLRILENYLQKGDAKVDGQDVKDGSWIMAVRVDDDDLWAAVKKGDLTGFSIGGYARRKPIEAGGT